MEFRDFRELMRKQFKKVEKLPFMFTVDLQKNELYDVYISSFPEEERQSHRCNSCRQFIENYGGVVAIVDGKLVTIWDFEGGSGEYTNTAKALADFIRTKPIYGPFVTKQAVLGTESNRTMIDNHVHTWNHFQHVLPANCVDRSSDSVEKIVGQAKTNMMVYRRGLDELSVEAVQDVLDLIAENNLYRGQQYKSSLLEFQKQQAKYMKLKTDAERDLFVWTNYKSGAAIRNTAIGTLLIDLSAGEELDKSVRKFELMMDPTRYNRTTAVVSKKQIEEAKKKIAELNYTEAIKRRHATVMDVPLEHALYVYRPDAIKDVFDDLAADAPVNLTKVKKAELTLEQFIQKIHGAKKVEIANVSQSNMVSLIAPIDNTEPLFAWDNNFSWTYRNNVADAIKEKVKAAGGSIEGVLRVSLEWYNHDDLDLYVTDPSGTTIYFANRRTIKGTLDVDANLGSPLTMTPVENIIFNNKAMPGKYTVEVKNFRSRHTENVGFTVQIEAGGQITNVKHEMTLRDKARVCEFELTTERTIKGFKILDTKCRVDNQQATSGTFTQVNLVTYSPNYWTNEVGNKHLFMFVDGLKTDEAVRPFMNEFLNPKLREHRKVFELLGSKLKIDPADDQLTGYGFSTTQRANFIARVDGSVYNVNV